MNLYSSENRSDQRSEESSDKSSDPYIAIVRGSDAYSVVSSYIAIVERGQGPLYTVESE
jgi:hypothetical protein